MRSLARSTSGVRGACWSSKTGIRTIDKWVNYSHKLAQTKQQVGECVIVAFLVHGRATHIHKLTRLDIIQTWGKPPPSPL
jgi:hypothetical protein